MHDASNYSHYLGSVLTSAHTYAGAVYTWGYNQDGQLGTGDYQGRATPTLVEDRGLESHNVVKVRHKIPHCCSILACEEQLPASEDACGTQVKEHMEGPRAESCPCQSGPCCRRCGHAGLQRGQALCSAHRQRSCLCLGLEQVWPAGCADGGR